MIRFFAYLLSIMGLAVLFVMLYTAPARADDYVETHRPFFWHEVESLKECKDPSHCVGTQTPDDVIALLGREPTHRWPYARPEVTGETWIYGDSAGYALVLNFRAAEGEQHPHLYQRRITYPSFLDAPE